jgi:hypothetical protein
MTRKLICGMIALSSLGMLWAADAYTGTWKMDVAKTTFAKGQEMKEVTAIVGEQGANLTIAVKGTSTDGKAVSSGYNFPAKGGAVTYTDGTPSAGAGATTTVKRTGNTLIPQPR